MSLQCSSGTNQDIMIQIGFRIAVIGFSGKLVALGNFTSVVEPAINPSSSASCVVSNGGWCMQLEEMHGCPLVCWVARMDNRYEFG